MERVEIQVVVDRRFSSADGYSVYGDGGSGVIDWDHVMTPRRQLFWPELPPAAGHLDGGHHVSPHLDVSPPMGHLGGTHLLDESLIPAGAIAFQTAPLVFGRFVFAVVTQDAAGNADVSGITEHSVVVNASPSPARDLLPSAFDAETGRMSFAFVASERLVG